MLSDDDRKAVADLALRALDAMEEDNDGDVQLVAAGIVFETSWVNEDGETRFGGQYRSLERNSPHHIAGLYMTTANKIMQPVDD